jgi:2-keto-4-pentenoate hydratase/2-oxohepta-3-ene-1,7-dioic acid hydratase in catechol pathway
VELARTTSADGPVVVVTSGDRSSGSIATVDGGSFDDVPALLAAAGGDAQRIAAGDEIALGGARLLPVVGRPRKVVCIGLNYRDHALETGAELPEEPVVFMKDPSTVVGPFDTVLIPRGSTKTDWEVELGVVVGAEARYLDDLEGAASCVGGYVLSHDVSERAFQLERGGQWDKGKSCETFNPFGPDLVPAEHIDDPQRLGLRLWVNGESRQDGSTANMLFSVAHVIWYVSQFMVLHPGDVINTGAPAGVALGLPGTPYLREGDRVELEIDGLGRASQRMAQA